MAVRLFEMVEDLSDDSRLGDEGHDAELSRALGANERVDFKHPSDEMGPSASKGSLALRAQSWLVWARSKALVQSLSLRLALSTFSSHDVGIVAVVKNQMSPRLWDLRDHSS